MTCRIEKLNTSGYSMPSDSIYHEVLLLKDRNSILQGMYIEFYLEGMDIYLDQRLFAFLGSYEQSHNSIIIFLSFHIRPQFGFKVSARSSGMRRSKHFHLEKEKLREQSVFLQLLQGLCCKIRKICSWYEKTISERQ